MLTTRVTKVFTEHPASEGETYVEHFKVAMGMSRQLAGAAMCAAVHAFYPNAHKVEASSRIRVLNDWLDCGDRGSVCDAVAQAKAAPAPAPAPGPVPSGTSAGATL